MREQRQFGGSYSAELQVGACTAINALGFSSHQTWAFRRAELTGYAESPFRLPTGDRAVMASVPTLDPLSFGVARFELLLQQALSPLLALVAAGARDGQIAKLGVGLALPARFDGRQSRRRYNGERRQLESRLEQLLSEQQLTAERHVQARGHASLGAALLWAGTQLTQRTLDIALVGGIDSYYDPDVMQDLMLDRRVFCKEQIDGFIPGEAASFALVGLPHTLRKLGLPTWCRIESVCAGEEPACMHSDLPCLGSGLSSTLQPASDRLRAEQRRLDWILGDVTNEDYRSHEFSLAYPRICSGVVDHELPLEFLPMAMGDLGAASLPTALAVAAEGLSRGDPVAKTCLLFASSVGEDRAGILVSAAEGR